MGPLTKGMPWIYTAIIRHTLAYCSIVWISAVENKTNNKRLERVQGMALKYMAGAMPSTPYTALNYLTRTPHITDYLKGEAAKGAVSTHGICCFTDGSKTEHGTGGGFVISDTRTETITEHSFKMKDYCTVFQAETAAIKHAAVELITFNNQQINFWSDSLYALCTTGSLQ